MSFLNKAKAAAQDVADKAQKGIDDVQTNRELGGFGRAGFKRVLGGRKIAAISAKDLEEGRGSIRRN